jgi:hypothetical protein
VIRDRGHSVPSQAFLAAVGGAALLGAVVSVVGLLSQPEEQAAWITYAGGLALAGAAVALVGAMAEARRRRLFEIRLRIAALRRAVRRAQFLLTTPPGDRDPGDRDPQAVKRELERIEIAEAAAVDDFQVLVDAGALADAAQLSETLAEADALLTGTERR